MKNNSGVSQHQGKRAGTFKMGKHTPQDHSSCPLSRPLGCQPQKCSPTSFKTGFSLARSSPVRQDWLASEPRGSPCLHVPALGFKYVPPHPIFYVGSGTQVLGFYGLSPQTL